MSYGGSNEAARLARVREHVGKRLTDAESDLDPESAGYIGLPATNRAMGRVSALREVRDLLREEPNPVDSWDAWNELYTGEDALTLRRLDGDR